MTRIKSLFWMTALCTAFLSFPSASHAANSAADHFSAADTDQDDALSEDEITAYYRTVFDTLDLNKDDHLDMGECEYGCVVFKPGQGETAEQFKRHEDISNEVKNRFAFLDKDGDGLVSREGFLNFFETRLMEKDTDKDGEISDQEYSSVDFYIQEYP